MKKKSRSPTPTRRVHEQLFEDSQIQKQRKELGQYQKWHKDIKQCTFQPRITPYHSCNNNNHVNSIINKSKIHSPSPSINQTKYSPSNSSTNQNDVYNRLYKQKQRDEQKMQKLFDGIYTFSPNSKSNPHIQHSPHQTNKIVTRLAHSPMKIIPQNKQKFTFHPQINKDKHYDKATKDEQAIVNKYYKPVSPTQSKQSNFIQINKMKVQQKRSGRDNLNISSKTSTSRSKNTSSSRNKSQKRTPLVTNMNQLSNQQLQIMMNTLSKLFNQFDDDQDGFISSQNIELQHSPVKYLKILHQVLIQIEEKDLTLNFQQFVDLVFMDQLAKKQLLSILFQGNDQNQHVDLKQSFGDYQVQRLKTKEYQSQPIKPKNVQQEKQQKQDYQMTSKYQQLINKSFN